MAKLQKNQFIVTEKQYTVAISYTQNAGLKQEDNSVQTLINTSLRITTVRATSIAEAKGLAIAKLSSETIGWNISNIVVEITGE